MRSQPALYMLASGTEPLQGRGQVARPAKRARPPKHVPRCVPIVAVAAAHFEYLEKK